MSNLDLIEEAWFLKCHFAKIGLYSEKKKETRNWDTRNNWLFLKMKMLIFIYEE